jgi:hypothetical protein
MIKTTPEHFEYFKYICLQWLKVFELSDWNIYFKHDDPNGNLSEIKFNLNGRIALCTFCTGWNDNIRPCTREEIFKVTKHEMIHALLGEFSELGSSRYVNEDQLIISEEALVAKLEKLIPNFLVDEYVNLDEFDIELNSGEGENGGNGDTP